MKNIFNDSKTKNLNFTTSKSKFNEKKNSFDQLITTNKFDSDLISIIYSNKDSIEKIREEINELKTHVEHLRNEIHQRKRSNQNLFNENQILRRSSKINSNNHHEKQNLVSTRSSICNVL